MSEVYTIPRSVNVSGERERGVEEGEWEGEGEERGGGCTNSLDVMSSNSGGSTLVIIPLLH